MKPQTDVSFRLTPVKQFNYTARGHEEKDLYKRKLPPTSLIAKTMKRIISSLAFVLGTIFLGNSQSLCNIDKLVHIQKNITSISTAQIEDFLLNLNDTCLSNVEYSECCNEILFLLLEKETEHLLQVIELNPKISIRNIKTMIENPVHDGINLQKLYSLVEDVDQYEHASREIQASLIIAISKY